MLEHPLCIAELFYEVGAKGEDNDDVDIEEEDIDIEEKDYEEEGR